MAPSPPPSPPLPAWAAANALFRRHRRLRPLLLPPASLRSLLPVLSHCLVSGLAGNAFVASRLLLASSRLSLPFSFLLLSHLPASSLSPFSFNSLIRASPPRLALRLFDQMRHRGVPADTYTLPFLIHACSGGDRPLSQSLHGQSIRLGYSSHLFTQTALMNMYFACGLAVGAHRVFDEMQAKDVVAWTGMVSGYMDSGMHLEAVEVFREMRGGEEVARPNVATVVSVASAYAGLGSLEYAKGLHGFVEKVGLECELIVRNALMDMYGKCGGIESARTLFNSMQEKDLHSWTTMISGLASHGHGKEAVALFFSMREVGVLPDSTTFIVVLSACSHAGLVDEGVCIFNCMESEYKVTPDIKHYGCMVDLFSRAGLLSRAYQFIGSMPFEPNLAILGALLSACSVNNELEIGELVLKKIESVCSHKGGASVLLSNIYANQNLWHEVDSIRRKIRHNAIARKPPGQSLIAAEVSFKSAIELSILSEYYGREIAAYNIQTTRCDLYGQEKNYSERAMLIYDGLHYDALAMSPFEGAPEEFDQTIYIVDHNRSIGPVESLALNLAKEAHRKRSYTDTTNFTLRCGVCQIGVIGQKEAVEHAQATGHVNFQEYK